jgi:hypothetical protein
MSVSDVTGVQFITRGQGDHFPSPIGWNFSAMLGTSFVEPVPEPHGASSFLLLEPLKKENIYIILTNCLKAKENGVGTRAA